MLEKARKGKERVQRVVVGTAFCDLVRDRVTKHAQIKSNQIETDRDKERESTETKGTEDGVMHDDD